MTFPHAYQPVRRMTGASVEDIQTALDNDEPLLLPAAVAGLPFFDRLQQARDDAARLAFLAETFGEREVGVVTLGERGRVPGEEKRVSKMPFTAFAAAIRSQLDSAGGDRLYMQNQPIKQFPEVGWKPLELSKNPDWHQAHSGLWIGAGGQTVNFHYDNALNLMCMLNGQKRVSLLPYEALPDLYPLFDVETNVIASSVRLLDPDWTQFPRFRKAVEALRVETLEPGDILLIPPHWWHHVESFGLNIMVNNWTIPFSMETWRAIGRNRAEAMKLFNSVPAGARADHARTYERVFRTGASRQQAAASPSSGDDTVDRNLAEAIALFDKVPDIWRRHGQLSYDYFAFHKYGVPMGHVAGALDSLIDLLHAKMARGEPVSALG